MYEQKKYVNDKWALQDNLPYAHGALLGHGQILRSAGCWSQQNGLHRCAMTDCLSKAHAEGKNTV